MQHPADGPLSPSRVAFAVGLLCLRLAHQRNALLMIIDLAAMIGSVLLTTPLAIRALTACGGRLPIAGRLAWRELGRNQARSAAALATVTTAVGISVSAVVITAANAHPATAGNLSGRQVLVYANDARDPALVPPRTSSQTDALDKAAGQVTSTLPGADLIPLSVAVDPTAPPSDEAQASGELDAAQVVRQHGQQLQSYPLYIATPQLLATFGGATTELDQNNLFAVDPTGTWSLPNSGREPVAAPAPLHVPGYTSLPQVLVSPAMVIARHWREVRTGWLIRSPTPLTAQQDAAQARAASLGLAIKTRDPQTYLGRLRLMFTVGGIAVTLTVIAIALVLLRTQSTRDQQILTAVGAPSRARRAIASTTATALVGLGTMLGIAGAYVTLILAYSDTLNRLTNIPLSALMTIGVGIPGLALITTWLTTSRQPPSINRPVIAAGLWRGRGALGQATG